MAEFRAAEAAVKAGTATPEQAEFVRVDLELLVQQLAAALLPVAPMLKEADSHAREILTRITSDGLRDFLHYIATNPPSGLTICALVRQATAEDGEAASRLLKKARQEQTNNARKIAAERAVMCDGHDWRESAREIAKGNDPAGKPWLRKERLIEYLMGKFKKSRSAVLRALNCKN